jgi:hypothetical protein
MDAKHSNTQVEESDDNSNSDEFDYHQTKLLNAEAFRKVKNF